jgi:hypothetical protein
MARKLAIKYTLNRAHVNTETSKTLFVQCPVCARSMRWSHETQKKFQNGGIGHQCSNCKSYIGAVICGNCSASYLMDDKEWCSIDSNNPYICSKCNEPLVPKTEGRYPIATDIIESKVFQAFTSKKGETGYVEYVKEKFSLKFIDELMLYHQTTYERLHLAESYMGTLTEYDFPVSFMFFNTPNFNEAGDIVDRNKRDQYNNLIYVFSTSLFSALESTLQEVNMVCKLGKDEWKVSYKLLDKIPSDCAPLNVICRQIANDRRFLYLKDLRNLLAHRRVTLLASNVTYDLPAQWPFRPHAVEGRCINYLPDKPLAKPGKGRYEEKKELKSTVTELYEFIMNSIDDIYLSLSKELGD